MTRLLVVCFCALLLGCLLVPFEADALPKGAVGYKLYHYEGDSWVRYQQGDPFPSGGATPGTNTWKYEYAVMNLEFATGIYQMYVFFDSENTDSTDYVSAVGPTGWSILYFPPIDPNSNWKVRFRTSNSSYYVMPGDTLCGYEVQFLWKEEGLLPPPQNYELTVSGSSEPGVTHELPPEMTPVEALSWGQLKNLFR